MTRRLLRGWLALKARPRLLSAVALGLVVWWALPESIARHDATRVLIGWNVGAITYLALALWMMGRTDTSGIARRALRQDDGRWFALAATVGAALAVLAAVVSQMAVVRDLHGLQRTVHVLLAAVTVVVAWLFVQTSFALHYAHDFYLSRSRGQPDALAFPGSPDPGYPDFMYFACVIGTSGQTADVSFVGGALRPIGAAHCVLAFLFNAALIGLTINIAASLF